MCLWEAQIFLRAVSLFGAAKVYLADTPVTVYSFDDTSGDTALSDFNIDAAPSYLFSVIKDIMSINSILKVHILPWSPPAWCVFWSNAFILMLTPLSRMKDGGTMGKAFFSSVSMCR